MGQLIIVLHMKKINNKVKPIPINELKPEH